ncbi:MAG: NUDIX domain-containing protein [Candidatus Gracilibacteria bacterium]
MTIEYAVVVIVKKGEKILMYNRKSENEDQWTVIGGHLECGESIFECAKREVSEETNIHIGNLKFLTILEDINKTKHCISCYVLADYVSGDLKGNLEEGIFELKWVKMKQLPNKIYKPFSLFLKRKTINKFNYSSLSK